MNLRSTLLDIEITDFEEEVQKFQEASSPTDQLNSALVLHDKARDIRFDYGDQELQSTSRSKDLIHLFREASELMMQCDDEEIQEIANSMRRRADSLMNESAS